MISMGFLVFLQGYASAQPISRSKENAATQELIQNQTGKQLTALDWYNRGVALNNNSDQELACYQRAVAIDPTFAPAYYNMGIIYMKRNKNAEAISSFNQFLNYSHDQAKRQEVQKAIVDLGGVPAGQNVPHQPLSADLKQQAIRLYNAGIALNNNSDAEMQYYLQAIVLYPEFAAAHMNLGLLYYHRKNYKNALTELTKYMEYTSDPPQQRKQVLDLIEWLYVTVKSSSPASQQQVAPAPAAQQVPGTTQGSSTGSPQMQEIPLQ